MDISHDYDDIINLPHHVSEDRPHMPMIDRAAQFAPFAALTGYDDAVTETARLTDQKLVLDEEQKQLISRKLSEIKKDIRQQPTVTVLYFIPDERKAGGRYATVLGKAKKIDELAGTIILTDGLSISFDNIYSIEANT